LASMHDFQSGACLCCCDGHCRCTCGWSGKFLTLHLSFAPDAARCLRRCLFWAKNRMDNLLWGKSEGDGKQLTPLQSMASGFSAACLGPVATGPFDVVKVGDIFSCVRCMGLETVGQVRWITTKRSFGGVRVRA